MTKLSDTQLLILSAAAQRDDGNVLPLPGSLRGGAAAKVVSALTSRGLIAECTSDGMAKADPALNRVWRNDGEGRAILLQHHRRRPRRDRRRDRKRTGKRRHGGRGRHRRAEAGLGDGDPDRGRSRAHGAHTARGHEAGKAHRHAAHARGCDHRRDRRRHRLAAPHGARRHRRGAEEEARARGDLGEGRGARAGLPAAACLTPGRLLSKPPSLRGGGFSSATTQRI